MFLVVVMLLVIRWVFGKVLCMVVMVLSMLLLCVCDEFMMSMFVLVLSRVLVWFRKLFEVLIVVVM